MKYQLVTGALGAALMLVGGGAVFAQQAAGSGGGLEEIVVTAEKREENLQKTPVSVTEISGEQLTSSGEATGNNFVAEALQTVVGVTVQDAHINVRGISASDVAGGFEPATAVYVDGIFEPLGGGSTFGSTGGNLDTGRIEVLRGPQGTLFGRSATGGVVNIITNDPTQEYGASGTMELGNYELRHFGGSLNVPVAPGLAFRAAVDSVDRDGYLSNLQDDNHERQMRLKGLYQTGIFSFMAAVYYEQYGSGYGQGTVLPFVSNPPTKYVTVTPCCAQFNPPDSLWETYGRAEVDLGFATATLIPSYTKQVNPTATSPILTFTQVVANPEIISTYDEFRLASKPASKLIWVVGGNFYRNFSTQQRTVTTSTGANLETQGTTTVDNAWGFFGEATYPITDTLRGTLGLRYSKEEQEVRQVGEILGVPENVDVSPLFTSTNYKARLDYDLRPESLLYASVSTGARPGGIATAAGSVPFASEKLTAYEIGSKNRFLNDRLQLNGSVFYYDYPSLQGSYVVFVGTVPVGVDILTNPAAYKGAELESLYQVTDDDKISLSVSALDAHYTSLTPFALSVFGTTQLANAPRWQASGEYDHRFRLPGGASLTSEVRATYKAESYIAQSLEAFAIQSSYTLYDASLIYASADGKYGVTGYVRNLTNEYYKASGTLNAGAALSSQAVVPGIPRTYGVVLSAHF